MASIGEIIKTIGKATALLFGIALISITLFVLNDIYHPFVVTNPDDPRFDASHFRFQHYDETNNQLKKAITKMFPPGTDRAFVEEILVKNNYAEGGKYQNHKSLPPEYTTYNYQWPPKGLGGWVISFIFDENNKSVMMSMGKPIYGTNPHYEEIQERKTQTKGEDGPWPVKSS